MDLSPPTEINVVTLNCWGLKYLSKFRRERLSEIGRRLAASDPAPHIVALQECWTQEDYRAIRRETRFVLPYGKFYFSGVFGSGLAILSRWPIEQSSMVRYPLNGRPTAFWRGDWYVGKGIACARIRYGPEARHVIEVFNTHTHSPYAKPPHENAYLCHRAAQSWELGKLLSSACQHAGHLVLALGDFNMLPLSLPYRILMSAHPLPGSDSGSGMRDVWRVLHPDSSLGASDDPAELARRRPIPTADFNIRENGATSNSVYCTWRWPKDQQRRLLREAARRAKNGGSSDEKDRFKVPPDAIDRYGKRLDYIFVGTGRAVGGDRDSAGGDWVVKTARVGMIEPHPTLGVSLSDHFSVEATLVWRPAAVATPEKTEVGNGDAAAYPSATAVVPASSRPQTATAAATASRPRRDSAAAVQDGTYLQSPTASSFQGSAKGGSRPETPGLHGAPPIPPLILPSADAADPDQTAGLAASTYDELLVLISAELTRCSSQTRFRAAHFFVSLFIAIGCLVAIWFVAPRAAYGAFVLILFSTLGLAAGTVDGLLALLFFNGSERAALSEFEWEVRNAKAAAVGGGIVGNRHEDDMSNHKVW